MGILRGGIFADVFIKKKSNKVFMTRLHDYYRCNDDQ